MTAALRRLTLKRFRSLRSAAVELDNPTFLLGQNGAGKRNIANAPSLLADAMTSPLAAVQDKRGGIGAVGHRSTSRGRVADVGGGGAGEHTRLARGAGGDARLRGAADSSLRLRGTA